MTALIAREGTNDPALLAGSEPMDEVLDRLDNVRRSAKGYSALCPAHDDHHPSLVVTEGDDGRVLLHCHAGCEAEEVVAALGLSMADLFPGGSEVAAARRRIEHIWREANQDLWPTKEGATAHAVLRTHCMTAWAAGTVEGYGLSERCAAELAGVRRETLRSAQWNLEEIGWLRKVRSGAPGKSAQWGLQVADESVRRHHELLRKRPITTYL
jgi:hypothetical protein